MPNRGASTVVQLSTKTKAVSLVVRDARQENTTHKMRVQAATTVQGDNTKIKIRRRDASTVAMVHTRIKIANRGVKGALEVNT